MRQPIEPRVRVVWQKCVDAGLCPQCGSSRPCAFHDRSVVDRIIIVGIYGVTFGASVALAWIAWTTIGSHLHVSWR